MKIRFRKVNLGFLKDRMDNYTILAALIVCVFTFLCAVVPLLFYTCDARFRGEVKQNYEVLQGVSVSGGNDWWENKTLRLKTGNFEYEVDFLPYSTRIHDLQDEMNDALRNKKVLIKYRDSWWCSRSVMSLEHDGKVYIDADVSQGIMTRRIHLLAIYCLFDLLVLIPMVLGIVHFQKKEEEL